MDLAQQEIQFKYSEDLHLSRQRHGSNSAVLCKYTHNSRAEVHTQVYDFSPTQARPCLGPPPSPHPPPPGREGLALSSDTSRAFSTCEEMPPTNAFVLSWGAVPPHPHKHVLRHNQGAAVRFVAETLASLLLILDQSLDPTKKLPKD